MSSTTRGSYVYCGAGTVLTNGVMAVIPGYTWDSEKRIVTLDASGDIKSFKFNFSNSDSPFAADDFGQNVKALALDKTAIGQFVIEIAPIGNGLRVRLSDGRAFDIAEIDGKLKKTAEEDHCLRVTAHDFYTFYDKQFFKSADGSAGGLVPLADGGIMHVIESGERDYRLYLKEENGVPAVYFENVKLADIHNAMPLFAYDYDGATFVYFADGKLVNMKDGSAKDVTMAGWLDTVTTMALHYFELWSGTEHSLKSDLPPSQAEWLDSHGKWKEPEWAGVGSIGAILPGSQNKLFKYNGSAKWQIPKLSGGFYISGDTLSIAGEEFKITSKTGSQLMQLIETSPTKIYPTGGVVEKVDAGQIVNYGVGYNGERWKTLSPADFVATISDGHSVIMV